MTDIVERLHGEALACMEPLFAEAADEIEEWRQAASVEAGLRREFLVRAEKAEAEIERLRAALEAIAEDDIDVEAAVYARNALGEAAP